MVRAEANVYVVTYSTVKAGLSLRGAASRLEPGTTGSPVSTSAPWPSPEWPSPGAALNTKAWKDTRISPPRELSQHSPSLLCRLPSYKTNPRVKVFVREINRGRHGESPSLS